MQANLFPKVLEKINLRDGSITLIDDYLPETIAQSYFDDLMANTDWQQETLFLFGKQHKAPRLSCWMAEKDFSYRYSNMTMQPTPWTEPAASLCKLVSDISECDFNSVLINLYRNGRDSNGWHADDEPELGDDPIIASLSLGGARDFQLRHKRDKANKIKLNLTHGSLLIMHQGMQRFWQHHIPKRAQAMPRINLTFRKIQK